jgi:uncharacterized membrane protein
MAFLRRLSSTVMLGLALAIQLFGELSARITFAAEPWSSIWAFLFVGGPVLAKRGVVAYPLIPWLSIMLAGWVVGRWLLTERDRMVRARSFVLIGVTLLVGFAFVRGLDGYGNWGLHRDSLDPLQWLHVAKYPPSLAYTALELGIAFVLLGLFCVADNGRLQLAPLGLLGSTAFFFYVLHVHVMGIASLILKLDPEQNGLAKTYLAAAAGIAALYPLCSLYRGYKSAHPDGWTRYL